MAHSYFNQAAETMDRDDLEAAQLGRLRPMVDALLADNAFYGAKLRAAGIESGDDLGDLDDYARLPYTTKAELSADQVDHPPWGTNLSVPRERFTRIHQTSGTTGVPLRCLDTDESWAWWADCWAAVYAGADVGADDRIFFAFSFGPFIGFWSAFAGANRIGALAVPGGGMTSLQRALAIVNNDITVLVCTPTYALHLAEVAQEDGIDIAGSSVRTTIHAGEPGAGIPATRQRIEQAWGARCYDHAGATEVGAWGFQCQARDDLHVNEGQFICEVIDPESGQPAEEGELVVTNLGRVCMPVVRYRTGDRVKLDRSPCSCGRSFHRLNGGVIGRIDDALTVRGVNVFPSAIENIVRRVPEVGEFAVTVRWRNEMDDMDIQLEISGGDPQAIVDAVTRDIRNNLGIRVNASTVPHGALPRFDLKARRFTDLRQRGD